MSINRPTGTQTRATGAANVAQAQAFFRGLISEMRRVTWPSREEWVSATVLTVALVVGIGVFTFVVDWIFEQIFRFLHGG